MQDGTPAAYEYYYPYGGNRGGALNPLTNKRFTGQYHEADLPGGEGLYDYGARWYDPQVGRFISADRIVPGAGNPQAFNRYSYTFNNPLRYLDPSGHYPIEDILPTSNDIKNYSNYQRSGGKSWSYNQWSRSEKRDGWSFYRNQEVASWRRGPKAPTSYMDPPAYSDWNSAKYSGCFKCHAGKNNGTATLGNDDLAETREGMQRSMWRGGNVLLGGVFEPFDWLMTGSECLRYGCTPALIMMTVVASGRIKLGPMDSNQQALKELVEEVTRGGRKPLTREEAETILDWAQEYNYPGWRASLGDVSYPSNWPAGNYQPHIHLKGIDGGHIKVESGVQPRP